MLCEGVVFINELLQEVEKAGLGTDKTNIAGLLLADDFVNVSKSCEDLQKVINMYTLTAISGD